MAKPVARAAMTSLWSPKMESAWVARARAATWKTVAVSSPAILYMLGIISSKPWDAVKVVASAPLCSAPCRAPAAPPSLCISTTAGTVPHRFGRRSRGPLIGPLAHGRGRRDGVDGDHLAELVGDVGRRLVAVEGDLPARAGRGGRVGRPQHHRVPATGS